MKNITIKDFLNLNNLRKLNDKINAHIDYWEEKSAVVSIESFEPLHIADTQRNNTSMLMDFQKKIINCQNLYLIRPTYLSADSKTLILFIKSKGNEDKNYSNTVRRYVEYKDDKNRKCSMTITVESLKSHFLLGQLIEKDIEDSSFENSQEFEEKVKTRLDSLAWKLNSDDEYGEKAIQDFFKSLNLTLLNHFCYNYEYTISLNKVNVSDKKIQLAYKDVRTYNTIPGLITIELMNRPLELIKLHELGIESKGYYDHTDKMSILPEQKDEVLNFMKRFEKV